MHQKTLLPSLSWKGHHYCQILVKIEDSMMFHHPSQMGVNDITKKMNQPGAGKKFEDETFPIEEDKPFFDIVLAKSNVKPLYKMGFTEEICPLLPSSRVPAVLTCNNKTWSTTLIGDIARKKFESATWKKFVIDNNLQIDDCLVFQIMESGADEIKFTVQILRGGFPAELEYLVAANTVNID